MIGTKSGSNNETYLHTICILVKRFGLKKEMIRNYLNERQYNRLRKRGGPVGWENILGCDSLAEISNDGQIARREGRFEGAGNGK